MKLIENLIGCIIGIFSLILLSFCMLLFALIVREAYRWSKEKMKNAIETLQHWWKSVKSRYFAIGEVARRYISKTMDALFISSKKITENIIRFVLMWSLPVVFILSIVAIIYIRKEESLLEKEKMIEVQQRELDMLKREYSLHKTLDSLNMVRNIEALDTTTKK